MIYYFCSFGTAFSEEVIKRKLVTSQAGSNRISEIVHTLCKENDITIVNIALTKADKSFDEYIEKTTLGYHVYFPKIECGRLQNIKLIWNAIQFVKKNIKSGDIIMFYNAHYLMLPIMYTFAYKKNIKIVYQIEELYSTCDYYHSLKRKLLMLSEKQMSKLCDAYITVSSAICNPYLEKKPSMVSYGYLDDNVQAQDGISNADDRLNIVYSGRLDVDGGIDVLMRAIPKIKCECNLIITGNGPLREQVMEYHNTNKNVHLDYKGFVSEEELHDILKKADICLSMLRTDKAFSQKSFPSKVVKYLSYGNLVLSSDVPALKEIKEKFSNLLIYTNEEEFVEKINEVEKQETLKKEKQKKQFLDFYDGERARLVQFFENIKKGEV